jgi:hypothetical protein
MTAFLYTLELKSSSFIFFSKRALKSGIFSGEASLTTGLLVLSSGLVGSFLTA